MRPPQNEVLLGDLGRRRDPDRRGTGRLPHGQPLGGPEQPGVAADDPLLALHGEQDGTGGLEEFAELLVRRHDAPLEDDPFSFLTSCQRIGGSR